ncbi:STAS domain-containing protein [bacterium]|nr:STAS domain-containing protein [bacterium]
MQAQHHSNGAPKGKRLSRFLPFIGWFQNVSSQRLRLDFLSGLTVALVLIPQSMAYAQLADLPAYYGLYAAFLPPLFASMFGSSHQLATGPVAVVSLMTSTALAPLATAGSELFIAYAIVLALLVGLFQFALGMLRLGMVVNFLSHPVVNGFTNAAALIIATSQLSKIFGVDIDKAEHHYETVYNVVVAAIHHTHFPTLLLAILAFAIMILLKRYAKRVPNVLVAVIVTTLISWATGFENNKLIPVQNILDEDVLSSIEAYNHSLTRISEMMGEKIELSNELKEESGGHGVSNAEVIEINARMAMLDVEVHHMKELISSLRRQLRGYQFVEGPTGEFFPVALDEKPVDQKLWSLKVGNRPLDLEKLKMAGGGAVVGTIPRGLPSFTVPKVKLSILLDLFPMAIIISLLGFMEAISIAKAMAAKTGQRLDPNQELIGQGLSNMVGSFFLSYPVSGSFSRSAVNIQAGAVTGLSNAFSSIVVMIVLLFLTPLLYHLPQSVLAAIIMMAVIGLLNVSGFIHAWHAQKFDGAISVITFIATLAFAPHLDKGIMLGVVLSLVLYLIRTMKPDTSILSRTPEGAYRSAERWNLETCRHVAVVRFSNSLFFANVNYLEEAVLNIVSSTPSLRHVLIVGNGMNELDASGEEMLSTLVTRLRERGLDISFSGMHEKVIDVMHRTHLFEKIGEDHFYHSVEHAVSTIHKNSCIEKTGGPCPLLMPRFKTLEVDEKVLQKMKKRGEWPPPGGPQQPYTDEDEQMVTRK